MPRNLDILYLNHRRDACPPAMERVARSEGVNLLEVEHVTEVFTLLERYSTHIDAVVIAPPSVGARRLRRRLRQLCPRLPVLISSGEDVQTLMQTLKHAVHPAAPGAAPPLILMDTGKTVSTAYAAYRLKHLVQPRPGEWQDAHHAALTWHSYLLDALATCPPGVRVHLRYLADPARTPALQIALVKVTTRPEAEMAHRLTARVMADLRPFFIDMQHQGSKVYQFVPVTDTARLQAILHPFRAERGVKLVRRAWDEHDPASASGALPDPLPLAAEPATLEHLCHLLVAQDRPTLLDIVLRPAPLAASEAQHLRSRQRLAKLWDPVHARLLPERIETLLRSGAGLFDVRLLLVQPSVSVAGTLQAAVQRDLMGASGLAKPLPVLVEKRGLFLQAIYADARDTLWHRFTPTETERLFRLPLPPRDGLAGPAMRPASCMRGPERWSREGAVLGISKAGLEPRTIRLAPADLRRHVYILGQTGTGKTTMLATMLRERIEAGAGVGLIDPHGDLIEALHQAIPRERLNDVLVFDPGAPESLSQAAEKNPPVRLNLIEHDPRFPEHRSVLIESLFDIFDQAYDMKSVGGPMFETYMRNALLLVMDDPVKAPGTLLDVVQVFQDDAYRARRLALCKNPLVVNFWEKEAHRVSENTDHGLKNITPYITSKLNAFVYNDYLRALLNERRSTIHFREVIDQGKILLVRLSKGRLGGFGVRMFGTVLFTQLLMAALSREDTPEEQRRDFFLFVDEFQHFTARSVAEMLSEARKYRLALVLANQTLGQLDPPILHAVLGNAGSFITFRPGIEDYERLKSYVTPPFTRKEMLHLPNHTAVARLLVDGVPAEPFLFETLPPEGVQR